MDELDFFRNFRRGVAAPSADAERRASARLASVLHEAVGRVQPARARHGGRRRVIALAAAVLVVVVGTASAFGGVRAFFLDKGFIGLPPLGATPSTPESGELEIFYWLGDPAGNLGRSRAWVYADGRLLWLRGGTNLDLTAGANRFSSGFLEQRLSPEGLELLRSEILSAGEFGHEPLHDPFPCPEGQSLIRYSCAPPQSPPGSEPLEVPYWVTIEVRDLGRLLSVDRASDLERLEARLTDPASWLPASAWEVGEIRAYVPSRYAVCFMGVPPIERSRLFPLLPEPAQGLLHAREFAPDERGAPCTDLTTGEARTLSEALDAAGLEPFEDERIQSNTLTYRLEIPGSIQVIAFEPYLPHGETPCSACG